MTLSRVQRPVRRKAVWGLKLTCAVAAFFVAGLAPNAFADGQKGQHTRTAKKVRPGEESSQAKQYKSDDEVTRRSSANPLHISSVIVTLVPGAQLPSEFKKFARAGERLDIINGQVLDLPNGLLRKLAAHKMANEAAGQTLQPTALVHEAWLRLGGDAQPTWQNRAHFFAAAAEAVRRILIDRARQKARLATSGSKSSSTS